MHQSYDIYLKNNTKWNSGIYYKFYPIKNGTKIENQSLLPKFHIMTDQVTDTSIREQLDPVFTIPQYLM